MWILVFLHRPTATIGLLAVMSPTPTEPNSRIMFAAHHVRSLGLFGSRQEASAGTKASFNPLLQAALDDFTMKAMAPWRRQNHKSGSHEWQ